MGGIGNKLSSSGQTDSQRYCQYYCEENIWHLCQCSSLSHRPRFVLAICNARRRTIFWSQKLSPHPDAPICWDYHMVLLASEAQHFWVIYDFDSICEFPSEAEHYLNRTFRVLPRQWSDYAPRFRLIPIEDFLQFFHSDRSHMRRTDGTWLHPPPKWPAILNERGFRYQLSELTDMNRSQPGWVGNLHQLRAKLAFTANPED